MRGAAVGVLRASARRVFVLIRVDLGRQVLVLADGSGRCLRRYSVSTSARGAGETRGSFCTPRGAHYIRAKIGAGQPINSVFRGRRPTGEIYTTELARREPGRDWILSRILWLCGKERGRNRLAEVDTMRRYIYIHGTPDDVPLGRPLSQGCIRMRNADILELFERVPVGTLVEIEETCEEAVMENRDYSLREADWTKDRESLRQVRYQVFVVEQKVDEALEWDGIDGECRHVLAEDTAGRAIACGRLLPDGHIGRMAVLAEWRGLGVGRAVLRRLVEMGREVGFRELLLNAQTHALDFYAREGFVPFGEIFIDADIPHRAMRLTVA